MLIYIKSILLFLFIIVLTACNNSQKPSQGSSKTFRVLNKEANTTLFPIDGQIQITFSKKIKISSITDANVYIIDDKKHTIDIELIPNEDSIIIKPKNFLQEHSLYTLVLTKAITSKDGQRLLNVFYHHFTTAKKADIDAPKIISVLPNTKKIDIASTFALQFNETLRFEDEKSLKFTDSAGLEVDGEYIQKGSLIRFIPTLPLKMNEEYHAELIHNVYDVANNLYTGTKKWSFRPNTAIHFNQGHKSFASSYSLNTSINSIKKIDEVVYVLATNALIILDPITLKNEYSINFEADLYDIVKHNDILYIASNKGILTYNPQTQQKINFYETTYPIYALDIHNDELYLAHTVAGITRLHVNELNASMEHIETRDTHTTTFDITCASDGYYVASYGDGVQKYGYDHTLLETIATTATARKLLLDKEILYIVDGIGGVSIYNTLTKKSHQIPSLSYTMDASIVHDVNQTYLFMAEKERGVSVYDISNLDAIKQLSQITNNTLLRSTLGDTHDIYALYTTDTKVIGISKSGEISLFSLFPDTSKLSVVSIFPNNLAQSVAPDSTIILTFNKAIDESTLQDVQLRNQNQQLIASTQFYDTQTFSLHVTPNVALEESAWVYVTLGDGLQDTLGNPTDFTRYDFSFKTYSSDVTAPYILHHYPDANSTIYAPFNGAITIQMSEALNSDTIANSINVLAEDNPISGSLEYNATSFTLSFQPDEPLLNIQQNYRVEISDALTDSSDNHFITSSFEFNVSNEDTTPPKVLSTKPSTLSVNLQGSTSTHIYFDEPIDSESVVASTVYLYNSTTNTKVANQMLNVDESSITIKHTALSDGLYEIHVNGVKDSAQNTMAYFYPVRFSVDATPPSVTSIAPIYNGKVLYNATKSQIIFSEAIQASTVNTTNISIYETGYGQTIPINSFTVSGNKVDVKHSALSSAYTLQYRIKNIKDKIGNTLQAYTLNFEPNARISMTTPQEYQSQVLSPVTQVIIHSDVPLDTSTINSTNIYLQQGTSGPHITGSLSYNKTTHEITINGLNITDYSNSYYLHVVHLKDELGNDFSSYQTFFSLLAP